MSEEDKRKKEFIPPFITDKTESDIEDIVIDGIARKRPTTIRYLCPFRRHLEPGVKYRWCACGKSKDVLCDDSCTPDDLAPMEFSIAKEVTWSSLCACRYTSSPPFCDGQHYKPEVGQDEWAEQHGIEWPPVGCSGSCSKGEEACVNKDQSKTTIEVDDDDEEYE